MKPCSERIPHGPAHDRAAVVGDELWVSYMFF